MTRIVRLSAMLAKTVLILGIAGFATTAKAEAPDKPARETPRFAVSTNMVHNLSASANLGAELGLGRKFTLDLPVTLNPWTFDKEENAKFKFLLFQPELRFWTCEAFNGHFFGLHGHYAYYNAGGMSIPPFAEALSQNRFEGRLYGAGISYGFQWIIGARWGMEIEAGAGYARLLYEKYPCQTCEKQFVSEVKEYWGITRIGFRLVYYLF